MTHYKLLAFFDNPSEQIYKFIVYGIGNLMSIVVFPKWISHEQARMDLGLREIAIYGGQAKFELRHSKLDHKMLSGVKIEYYYKNDGRDESVQVNDLYLFIITNWRERIW